MNINEQKNLVEALSQSYTSVIKILEGVDLGIQVYPNSDWKIKDILVHLAAWDCEVTKSIQAFIQGSTYSIPNLELDSFNQETTASQSKLTPKQSLESWEQARKDFQEAVMALPPDLLDNDFLYPWGNERGNLPLIVSYMIDHDTEHKDELLIAIRDASEK